MLDQYQRSITYMRVSVTDRCNFRCLYCMPEAGVNKLEHSSILSFEEILNIVKAGVELGIKKVRVTGGEPLVRKGVVGFIQRLSAVEGIEDISMTTNASLLAPMAKELKQAGLNRVNISLDTLNPEKFKRITRLGTLEDSLRGLYAALDYGLGPVKVNTVLMGGWNDDEIERFVGLTREYPVDLRFIELMPIGDTVDLGEDAYLPVSTVLEKVPALMPLSGGDGVAAMYQLPGAKGRVGLISPVSNLFCGGCNRVRITSDGKVKPCLHSEEEISLKGLDHDALVDTLRSAIYYKPSRHDPLSYQSRSKSARDMNRIGG